jgi:hypothetical protein
VWAKHYLPHDAEHERQDGEDLKAPIDDLKKLKIGGEWVVVPRVPDISHGIQLTRAAFSQCRFDEAGCKEGIAHLDNYSKSWNERAGCWSDIPKHDIHSEAADAIRQFAQGYVPSAPFKRLAPVKRNWRTA